MSGALGSTADLGRGMLPISEVVQKNRETLLAQQLQLEQQQFERLKHDFSYNLSLLRERDMLAEVPIVRLHDYFYYKEHLLIVTELLRDSIFNFYRYLRDTSPEGHGAYFSLDTLRTLSTQLLTALAFMHQQDIVHCDLKPENVCIASA